MKTSDIIELGSKHLSKMAGHELDVLTLTKPVSAGAAIDLSKVISKLSPLLGNMIEFNTVEYLNREKIFHDYGIWRRQDPGFPDAVFDGNIQPTPGFEIKAWFPLATEITARFKDSQNHFKDDQTYVAMLAWLPEHLLFGKPHIVDVCIVSGLSVAKARDDHYHNAPDYIVLEPEDTSDRTRNLQQTNTNGYKFQGTAEQLAEAKALARTWGDDWHVYKPSRDYQDKLRQLIAKYPYRLDTNFAKMDRIVHPGIEEFKKQVLEKKIKNYSIQEWIKILTKSPEDELINILKESLDITEVSTGSIVV
ncbi:hypothetical protein [Terasakiella pusilla]|uniref:hypothetical protein n=1 Tax=Terasakiella pusilla TaxID=64973 RepID=UPI003AA9DE2D